MIHQSDSRCTIGKPADWRCRIPLEEEEWLPGGLHDDVESMAHPRTARSGEELSSESLHHELLRRQHQKTVAHCHWIMMSQETEHADASTKRRQQSASRSIFDVPTPIKQLFDKFPLITYPINDLPQRAPRERNTPILHIFTTTDGAAKGAPSYNPACLKWQVRTNVEFRLRSVLTCSAGVS